MMSPERLAAHGILLYILHKISLCFSTFKSGTGSIIIIDFYGFKRYHLSMEPVPQIKWRRKGAEQ
jgi:hypothetical protein